MNHLINILKNLVVKRNQKVDFLNFKQLSMLRQAEESECAEYITAQEFIQKFLDSIKTSKVDSFKKKYSAIEKLTILNIEDFQGKDGSSYVLKDIVMIRNKTTLVSRMKKNEILKSDRFCEDFKFLIS